MIPVKTCFTSAPEWMNVCLSTVSLHGACCASWSGQGHSAGCDRQCEACHQPCVRQKSAKADPDSILIALLIIRYLACGE